MKKDAFFDPSIQLAAQSTQDERPVKKAAFFDRDGTIIHDAHYLSDITDITLLDEGVRILKACRDLGYELFVVTNQSGIARGYFDTRFVKQTHEVLSRMLVKEGIHIVDYALCPHHPDFTGPCRCRKPAPGMLTDLADTYHLDLSASLMFGDKQSDLQAGMAAGCQSFDIAQFVSCSPSECATLISGDNIVSNEGISNG